MPSATHGSRLGDRLRDRPEEPAEWAGGRREDAPRGLPRPRTRRESEEPVLLHEP